MISMGVLLKGNVARMVTLSGSRTSHTLVGERLHKLELPHNPTQDDVDTFVRAFKACCTDFAVDVVTINRRATSGQGAGGPATFLTEGVLLATSPCPITAVHSATVRATERRSAALKTGRPATADLGKAYDLAFESLT